jgi:hypothetical protein
MILRRLVNDVDVDVGEISCMILISRCSLKTKTFDEEQNHARSKVPKFDYFDSKTFNFSSLFLIRLFENLPGKTKAGILL